MPEQVTQRMGRVELVVAVRDDDQRRNVLDLAAEQLEHVERRLVGPVGVLDDKDGRRVRAKLTHECRRHVVADSRGPDGALELATHRLADVEQRSQRAWCEQRVAHPDQDTAGRCVLVAKAAYERGLPDTRFAVDQHQPTVAAGCVAQSFCEHLELTLTLQEGRVRRRRGRIR